MNNSYVSSSIKVQLSGLQNVYDEMVALLKKKYRRIELICSKIIRQWEAKKRPTESDTTARIEHLVGVMNTLTKLQNFGQKSPWRVSAPLGHWLLLLDQRNSPCPYLMVLAGVEAEIGAAQPEGHQWHQVFGGDVGVPGRYGGRFLTHGRPGAREDQGQVGPHDR